MLYGRRAPQMPFRVMVLIEWIATPNQTDRCITPDSNHLAASLYMTAFALHVMALAYELVTNDSDSCSRADVGLGPHLI